MNENEMVALAAEESEQSSAHAWDVNKPPEESGDASSHPEPTMSKNQMKKQRKRERWLVIKQERRRHIKENRKRRLAEMREKGEDLGPTRKSLKSNTMKNSSCKIRVVLDLSLDEYMAEKDVNSLSSQLQHSYSANRRAQNPLQLYLCSLGGKTKQRLDEIGDYKGWDVYLETESYEQLFPKESLVYLTSESPNILSSLSQDKVYIIGGLVDHNKHKGLCHKIAEERGIAHAQLPIAEYLDMKTRKVLAVNHVFSILLRYTETHDWRTAFLAEMPQRKQAHLKGDEAEVVSGHTDTADVGVNRVCDNSTGQQDNSKVCIKGDDADVNGTHNLTLISCSTKESTPEQTSLVSCTDIQHIQEINEQKLSVEPEIHSKFSLSTEDKTQDIEQVHGGHGTEKSDEHLQIITS
ncbi:hypothetical protein BsWGS_05952 [Bradybaena similaris]